MHILHQLLPNPLGDTQEVIRRQVFGPRAAPGVAASPAPSGPAGGDLSGTYPNPSVVPENASLLLAARAFLPHPMPARFDVVMGASFIFDVSSQPYPGGGGGKVTLTPSSLVASRFMASPSGAPGQWSPRAVVAADLSSAVFVAAGGSHAAGAVPDPGATAHANQPYALGDDAAFHQPRGYLLGVSSVATDQSTASTTNVDLTTLDSVSFTLDETRNVLVVYTANVYNNTANVNARDCTNFDGTDDSGGQVDTGLTTANSSAAAVVMYQKSLASGSHTVKIRHAAVSGGTGHWRNRVLTVWLAP